MTEPLPEAVPERDAGRRGSRVAPPQPPREIDPALARKNLLFALTLFGLFVALFAGTVVVALIYLAVAD